MLNARLRKAIELVHTFIIRTGIEYPAYIAYSAGKDSAVLLDIIHKINPGIPVIMNSFDGQESDFAMIFMKKYFRKKYPGIQAFITLPPKEQGLALSSLFFSSQFDGSRIAEAERSEKSTIFIDSGVEINRGLLEPYVDKGLRGMKVCYPIYDWTDEDVAEYILSEDLEYYG